MATPPLRTDERVSARTGVEYVHRELWRRAPDYQLIADCIEGQRAIKGQVWNEVTQHIGHSLALPHMSRSGAVNAVDKARYYLPQPNPGDTSDDNQQRYKAYLNRAIFYNATKRTQGGYVGQLFQRPPTSELPEGLDVVAEDATGERIDIDQLAKDATAFVLPFGRSGVLADYPTTDGGSTRAEVEAGHIRPTLKVYEPWNITNWRTRVRGAKKIVELIVLRESYTVVREDGFTLDYYWQYRVLQLEGDVYTAQLWRHKENSTGQYEPYGPRMTPMANGQTFDTIPFFFIGSKNNDHEVDPPPFLDLANMNVGHYRNSADYEEACYMLGQPTLWAAGLTQKWYEEVLKGEIFLGSRATLPLPEGATAGLLQVEPNTMPHEAMEQKQRQMTTLGARIGETPDVMRTATEATFDVVETASPVVNVANNVSKAFTEALKVCARFEGLDEDKVNYTITTEAQIKQLLPEEHRQARETWIAGGMTDEEFRAILERAGLAGMSDRDAALALMQEAQALRDAVASQPMTQESNNAEGESQDQ